MMRGVARVIPAVLLATACGGAHAAPASYCAMPQEEANHSPMCVRWYFACELAKPMAPATGANEGASFATRHRIRVYAIFKLAERNCEQFSYQEAVAAIQASVLLTPAP